MRNIYAVLLGLFVALLLFVVLYYVFWLPLGLEICRKTPDTVVERAESSPRVEKPRPHRHHVQRKAKQMKDVAIAVQVPKPMEPPLRMPVTEINVQISVTDQKLQTRGGVK